ncbi:MAG: P-loop NTPase [Candidatus Nanoarchaeia archaeon]
MARFITILSGKGGVGKTTSAVNLGLALSKLGANVIVMDGNLSSPNLSVHLGNTYFPTTIHDVMSRDEPIQKAIYEHKSGFKIIPADVAVDSMRFIDFDKLRSHIQDLHLLADYVIIDGSPGLGRETTRLLELSDSILVVTNPDRAAVIDAKRLLEFSKRLKKPILGLVLTKYKEENHTIDADHVERYLEMPVLSKIPHDEYFDKAIHLKQPFLELYPGRKASKEYLDLARKIIDAHYLNPNFLK